MEIFQVILNLRFQSLKLKFIQTIFKILKIEDIIQWSIIFILTKKNTKNVKFFQLDIFVKFELMQSQQSTFHNSHSSGNIVCFNYHQHISLQCDAYKNVKPCLFGTSVYYGIIQKAFSQGNFPTCYLPSANFPNVQFPKRQLPKA